MASKKGIKALTAKDFEIVKTLLFAELSVKKIAEAVSRSRSTIHLIQQSENYEDYKKTRTEQRTKHLAMVAKKDTVVESIDKSEYVLIDYEYLNSVLMGLSKSQENLNHRLDIIYGLINDIHEKYMNLTKVEAGSIW